MVIKDIVASPGLTGFYFDDQKAIKQGRAVEDGFTYKGTPVNPGFTSIRQAGESISIQIILEDGQVAVGDCAAVQYSGAGGRDPLFLASEYLPIIRDEIRPLLVGKKLASFRELAHLVDNYRQKDGKRLHTACRYGLSQVLLDAVAKAKKQTITEIIVEEYDLELVLEPIAIFSQSGDDRYNNADKMIIKQVPILSHGLFNNINKLGSHGEKLIEYITWVKNRIIQLGAPGYQPILHMDVYGTIGEAFANNIPRIVEYFKELEKAAAPHKLRIEGPIDLDNREEQIRGLAELTRLLDEQAINVEVVADEWCNTLEDVKDFARARAGHIVQIKTPDLGGLNNTVEAVIFCKAHGIGAYLGGTCNETDRSAQVCMQVAVATQPIQMLSKPGMGVDEALSILTNEMNRTLALLQWKASQGVV